MKRPREDVIWQRIQIEKVPEDPVKQHSEWPKCIGKWIHAGPEHLPNALVQPLDPEKRVEIIQPERRKPPGIKSRSQHECINDADCRKDGPYFHTEQRTIMSLSPEYAT